MPLRSGFKVMLNGAEVSSSKESLAELVSFSTGELADERIAALNSKYRVGKPTSVYQGFRRTTCHRPCAGRDESPTRTRAHWLASTLARKLRCR